MHPEANIRQKETNQYLAVEVPEAQRHQPRSFKIMVCEFLAGHTLILF